MRLVNLQLTERHLGYCYGLIESVDTKRFARTVVAIEDALRANLEGPDAVLTVQIYVDNVVGIYEKASMLPEGYATIINNEISDLLVPQLMPYAYQEAVEKATAEAMAEQANAQEQARVDAINAQLLADYEEALQTNPETPYPSLEVPVLVQPVHVDMSVTEALTAIQAINQRNVDQREADITASILRAKAG